MRRRILVSMLAVAILGLVPLTPAGAANSVTRLEGPNRILTAIELSQRAFPASGSAPAVVVARDRDFADALAAAPLAVAAGGPVLLNPQEALDDEVKAEIERLGASTVYLMGGSAAQSTEVERALKEDTDGVDRVIRVEDDVAKDRFGTAAEAARLAADLWGGSAGNEVLVTLGRNWPDALSAGQLAGHARRPILLVEQDEVPPATNDALRDLGADVAIVIGGTAAVSQAAADDLDVASVERIGGKTRYDTGRLVADAADSEGGSLATVIAATGARFADGLAAGPASVHLGGVMVLVHPGHLADSPYAHDWLADRRARIGDILVAGGPAAVSDQVVSQLAAATGDLDQLDLAFDTVATFDGGPIDVETRPGDARLYVATREGKVWQTFPDGGKNLFLDISDRVHQPTFDMDERGLLGIAFHPTQSNRMFAYYTRRNADDQTRLSEFRIVGGAADPTTEAPLDSYDQPFSNHNGGGLEFAPDGTLWLALGDGGGSNDPDGNGQDASTQLGSLLRYRIDGAAGSWSVPADNPFAAGGGHETIAHHGLRNPFRFSFDPIDERLLIGDVGQGAREEIDAVGLTPLGRNFGWACREGTVEGPDACTGDFTAPVHDYPLDGEPCAVTGGVVYRGRELPELAGTYLFADFCEGTLRSLRVTDAGVAAEVRLWTGVDAGNPAGFGTDSLGDVFVADAGGRLLKLVRA